MVPKIVPRCNCYFKTYTNYQNCPEICPQICPSELRGGSQYRKCAHFLLCSGRIWGPIWGPFSGQFFPSESGSRPLYPHTHGQEGKGEVEEASPEDEAVCVCGTHRCVKLLHTRIHLVSHLGSQAVRKMQPFVKPL